QQRQPVVQRLDDGRGTLRDEHGERVRLEGERDGLPFERARTLHRGAQDRLMPEVHAVEVAERQHHAAEPLRAAREVPDDAHQGPLYLTRRGYAAPPREDRSWLSAPEGRGRAPASGV